MKNEGLVRLTTEDVSKAFPITDTKIISDVLKLKHHSVTRIIRNYEKDFEEFGKVGFEIQALESGQSEKVYLLNEQHFVLIVTYFKNTELVREYKKKFVKSFFFMKNELQARSQTRNISKVKRKSLTDAIKKHVVNEGNFKSFAYSTYSKLVYKKVLGMTVKKFKDKNNLKESDNVRDFLTIEQLEQVQELESKIATYIQMRTDLTKDDKLVYEEVKKVIDGEVEV